MNYKKYFIITSAAFTFFSCTKLDESFRSELEQNNSGSIAASQLLISAYNSIGGTFQTGDLWHISQHTTDETIAPTRGGDWDDNGAWRALHAHTWNDNQSNIRGAFNGLLSAQFAASNVLQFNPNAQEAAEAKFLRALSMYHVLDGWDQVPYREDLLNYKINPTTLKGLDAANFIETELNSILSALPATGQAYVANQDAAKVLLMKLYLNKGVYANRAAPTFDAADMNKVISLADEIINSGKYALSNVFYDNFAPDNNVKSKENIFTFYNQNGDRGANVQGAAFQVHHYKMNPSGWNGFATLSDFYDKFEAADQRRGMYYAYPAGLPNPGKRVNVGFLIGQQYDWTTDAPLEDRKGNKLIFTREVKLKETGENLEVTGIRVNKYPYDYPHKDAQNDNDWALFRYADVLLMKAEALMRTGKDAEALIIVNTIRAKRLATPLVTLSLDVMLDERGREMYWEGWRRQDLIRFGKYLAPWQEKAASDPKVLLFPIPSDQLAVNPNLEQNPGY